MRKMSKKMKSKSRVNGNDNQINQIGTCVNYGLSYKETKEVCQSLIENEISKLSREAKEEALRREERLNDKLFKLLEEIKLSDKEAINEIRNPDMQFSFIEAQHANIRVGTEEMENVLSNLLKERLLEKERTTLQIALSEAIKVAPLLLPVHFNILSLVFTFKYTRRYTISNEKTFAEFFSNLLEKCLNGINDDRCLYQHIEYSKCGNLSIMSYDIAEMIKSTYGGLFMKGFTYEEFMNRFENEQNILKKSLIIIIPHLREKDLFQINAMSEDVLKDILEKNLLSKNEVEKVIDFYRENMLSNKQIEQRIIKLVPDFKTFIELWNKNMNQLQLTSVGIILGIINLKNLIGENYDMKIWVK